MFDPYAQQSSASMYMNPWQGYTSNSNMMSAGPQGYMGAANSSNMKNQFTGGNTNIGASQFGQMYDNPFTTSFGMMKTNTISRPMGSNFASFNAHADNISMGASASLLSASTEIGSNLAGSAIGAAIGQAMIPIPVVGGLVGGLVGGAIGGSLGGSVGSAFANRAGKQSEVHRSLMGLSNNKSPYGGGFGYGRSDTKEIFNSMEDMVAEDPMMGMGEVMQILDKGIKTGSIKGGGSAGDIKNKLKGLKEQAKALVEIFNDSDIGEIMDTLRRLNGTGMSGSQAVEASRNIGITARTLGMKEGDYFNQVSQKAEVKEMQGMQTSATTMNLDVAVMKGYTTNDKAQANFRSKDEFNKALEGFQVKDANLTSGENAGMMLSMNQMSTAAKLTTAEAMAIQEAGGQEAFSKLSRKERDALRPKSLKKLQDYEEGGGNDLALLSDLVSSGALSNQDYTNILGGKTKALVDKMSGNAAAFFNKDTTAGEGRSKKKRFDYVSSSESLQLLYGVSYTQQDRSVANIYSDLMSSEVQRLDESDKQGSEASKLIKASAVSSKVKAFKTRVSASIGRFGQDMNSMMIDKLHDGESSVVAGQPITMENVSKAIAIGSSTAAATLENGNGTRSSFGEMLKKDGLDTGFFNNFDLKNSASNDYLNGLSNSAGLSSLVGNISSVDTLAMIKSSGMNREAKTLNTIKANDLFDKYSSGDISFDEFKAQSMKTNTDAHDSLVDLKSKVVNKGGYSSFSAQTANRENRAVLDSGVLTPYALSLNDSKQGLAAKLMHTRGTSGEMFDKGREIIESATGVKESALEAVGSLEKVDFKELQTSIDSFGLKEGVSDYMMQSGLGKSMSKKGSLKLKKALVNGGGTKEGATKNLKYETGALNSAMMSSGVNIDSALETLGMKRTGSMTKDQVEEFAHELINAGNKGFAHEEERDLFGKDARKKTRVNGYSTSLNQTTGLEKQANLAEQKRMGEMLLKNSAEVAMSTQSGYAQAMQMHAGTNDNSAGSKFQRSVMGDTDASKAVVDMLEFSDSRKKRIFEAAQEIRGMTLKDKKYAVSNQANMIEWQKRNPNMSKADIEKAHTFSKQEGIADIDYAAFAGNSMKGAAVQHAIQTARGVLGKSLDSSNQQAQALGLLGSFKKDKDGKIVAKTDLETMSTYEGALEKEDKDRTYEERLLVSSGKRIKEDEKEVTGAALRREDRLQLGLGGVSDKLIADRANNVSVDPQIDLLRQINENLNQLVTLGTKNADGGPKIATGKDEDTSKSSGVKISAIDRGSFYDENSTIDVSEKTQGAQSKKSVVKTVSKKISKEMEPVDPGGYIQGLTKNDIITKKDVSLKGIAKDTASIMSAANNIFRADGKQMVVTSGTDSGKGSANHQHKDGSRHDSGKAFDVGMKSFKNKEEASAFGKKLQKQLQEKYEGGIKVIAEKNHFHVSATKNKKDGMYHENSDAFTTADFGGTRKPNELKAVNFAVPDTKKEESKSKSKTKDSTTSADSTEIGKAYQKSKELAYQQIMKQRTSGSEEDQFMYSAKKFEYKGAVDDPVQGKKAKSKTTHSKTTKDPLGKYKKSFADALEANSEKKPEEEVASEGEETVKNSISMKMSGKDVFSLPNKGKLSVAKDGKTIKPTDEPAKAVDSLKVEKKADWAALPSDSKGVRKALAFAQGEASSADKKLEADSKLVHTKEELSKKKSAAKAAMSDKFHKIKADAKKDGIVARFGDGTPMTNMSIKKKVNDMFEVKKPTNIKSKEGSKKHADKIDKAAEKEWAAHGGEHWEEDARTKKVWPASGTSGSAKTKGIASQGKDGGDFHIDIGQQLSSKTAKPTSKDRKTDMQQQANDLLTRIATGIEGIRADAKTAAPLMRAVE